MLNRFSDLLGWTEDALQVAVDSTRNQREEMVLSELREVGGGRV